MTGRSRCCACPTGNHYTVVLACEPDGAALVDQEQIDVWVARWGQWLAALGDEPGVIAASVTIETAPDTGTRLRNHVTSRIDPQAPPVSKAILSEVVEQLPRRVGDDQGVGRADLQRDRPRPR